MFANDNDTDTKITVVFNAKKNWIDHFLVTYWRPDILIGTVLYMTTVPTVLTVPVPVNHMHGPKIAQICHTCGFLHLCPLLLSKLGSSHLQWEFFEPYIYLQKSGWTEMKMKILSFRVLYVVRRVDKSFGWSQKWESSLLQLHTSSAPWYFCLFDIFLLMGQ